MSLPPLDKHDDAISHLLTFQAHIDSTLDTNIGIAMPEHPQQDEYNNNEPSENHHTILHDDSDNDDNNEDDDGDNDDNNEDDDGDNDKDRDNDDYDEFDQGPMTYLGLGYDSDDELLSSFAGNIPTTSLLNSDATISGARMSKEDLKMMKNLENQMNQLRSQGYSFENPYQDEDDEWYEKNIIGKPNLDLITDDESDDNGGNIGTLHQQNPLNQFLNRKNNDEQNVIDNIDPLSAPMVIEDVNKTQLQEMVARQMMVAAGVHTLEMAALDMRIAAREVSDLSSLTFAERQATKQREKLRQKLSQHEQQQYRTYEEKERRAALIGTGIDQITLENYNSDEGSSAKYKAMTKLQKISHHRQTQLEFYDSVKPTLLRGQHELGVNIFEIFNLPKHALLYYDEIARDTILSSLFETLHNPLHSFISPYKNHLELQFRLHEPNPDTRAHYIDMLKNHKYNSTNSQQAEYQSLLLNGFNIPQHYMYNHHLINTLHNITQLSPISAIKHPGQELVEEPSFSQPHPLISTTSLPSLSQQLSSMLLMKEIQRFGVLSPHLTLFHIFDVIIRICDDFLIKYTDSDVETLFDTLSFQHDLINISQQAQKSKDVKISHYDDLEGQITPIKSNVSQQHDINSSLLLNTIIEDIATVNPTTVSLRPKKYSLGREILGVLLTTLPPNDYSPPQLYHVQQQCLTDLYAECILLRYMLATSWKAHVEQYNSNACNIYATNTQTGEIPYYTSPPPNEVIPSIFIQQLTNQQHTHIPVSFENRLTTPPLSLWTYSITNSTISKFMLLFIIYDCLIDIQIQRDGGSDLTEHHYIRYLDLSPPLPFDFSTVSQNYEQERDSYEAHLLLLEIISDTKNIIIQYLHTNDQDIHDDKNDTDDDNTNNNNIPLLLETEWISIHNTCLHRLTSVLYKRLPSLLLPTEVGVQVPFLVVSALSNDADEKLLLKQESFLKNLALISTDDPKNVNSTTIAPPEGYNDIEGENGVYVPDEITEKDEKQFSRIKNTQSTKSKKSKNSKKPMTKAKKINKTKQQMQYDSLYHNAWKETHISTGADTEDQINDKIEKEKGQLAKQKELEQLLYLQNTYNFAQQTYLYKNYYLYPFSFPFVPKLPPLPASLHAYIQIMQHTQAQFEKWSETRENFLKNIDKLMKDVEEQGNAKELGGVNPPAPKNNAKLKTNNGKISSSSARPMESSQIELLKKHKTQIERAFDDLQNETSPLQKQLHNDNTDNTDNDHDEDNEVDIIEQMLDAAHAAENSDEHLLMPMLSLDDVAAINLPQEHFGNLTATSLHELCLHGSQQYQEYLQQERMKLLLQKQQEVIAQGSNISLDEVVFTPEDLNNLQLFPNVAVDNAYSFIIEQQQQNKFEAEQLEEKKQHQGDTTEELAHKLSNNLPVRVNDTHGLLDDDNDNDDNWGTNVDNETASFDYNKINQASQFDPLEISKQVKLNAKKTRPYDDSEHQAVKVGDIVGNTADSKNDKTTTYAKLPTSLTLLEHQKNSLGSLGDTHFDFGSDLSLELSSRIIETKSISQNTHNITNIPLNMNANIFPDEKRDICYISRSGTLLLPLVQNIPFVFDTMAQIAGYNATKQFPGNNTTSNSNIADRPTQKPIYYFQHSWVDDIGINIQDKSITLFAEGWDRS